MQFLKGTLQQPKKRILQIQQKKLSLAYRIQWGWDLHSRLVIIRIEANFRSMACTPMHG